MFRCRRLDDGGQDLSESERFPPAESSTNTAQSAPEMEYHCICCGVALEVGECQPCNACVAAVIESDRPLVGRIFLVRT